MLAFLSYSRKHLVTAQPIAEGLQLAGHEVWLDQELGGGVEWWQKILEQIRRSDVFLAVVSQSSLASIACAREREYALSLAKPVLPVMVEAGSEKLLPTELAQRQAVDFTVPDVRRRSGSRGLWLRNRRPHRCRPSYPPSRIRRCPTSRTSAGRSTSLSRAGGTARHHREAAGCGERRRRLRHGHQTGQAVAGT